MHALFYYPLGFKVENYSFQYAYIRPDRNACLQLTGTAARWLSGLSTARCEFGSWNSSERNSSCLALWAAGPWCHTPQGSTVQVTLVFPCLERKVAPSSPGSMPDFHAAERHWSHKTEAEGLTWPALGSEQGLLLKSPHRCVGLCRGDRPGWLSSGEMSQHHCYGAVVGKADALLGCSG